jgi:conserved oligomeric Golgi complex subunit 4
MASTIAGSAPSTRPPISSLSSESAIRAALGALDADSSALDAELSALLSARAPLDNAAARVRALSPTLAALRTEAIGLRETVGATARTAERVGGRVRDLDEQMHRVREAAERVNQVIDLKVCMQHPAVNRWLMHVQGCA